MKRIALSTILSLGLLLSAFCNGQNVTTNNDEKRQVAVFVYCDENVTTPINALRAKLTSSLINEKNGSYVVVDRSSDILSALKAEYKYQGSGMVSDEQLISVGQNLGAFYLCVVNVTYYINDKQYFFECKLVNVEKRQIEKQSFYPTDNTIISSLSPQEQLKVAGALATAFELSPENRVVGEAYYNDSSTPVYVEGNLMRVGYVDQTGKHGIAYVVLPKKHEYPYLAQSDYRLQIPTIQQMEKLFENKDLLDLAGEYWTTDSKGTRNQSSYHHFSFNFSTGQTEDRWSMKLVDSTQGGTASIGSKIVRMNTATGETRTLPYVNDLLNCINILIF